MTSKYLDSLAKNDKERLVQELYSIQNRKCFICQQEIDLNLQTYNIDHIIPLANKGKDQPENFALTHEFCNKSKLDADLNIARILFKLKNIQKKVTDMDKTKSMTLGDVLTEYGGGKYDITYAIENNIFKYTLPQTDTLVRTCPIFTDHLSKEKFIFIELPIEYIHHSDLNPRGINNNISKLIKEFHKHNPQLHLGLAILQGNKIKVFDGQHKAVAQIVLGSSTIVLRVFISPDIERLRDTNNTAGSTLKQVAFDRSILRQLNSQLYTDKVNQYRKARNLDEQNYSFSEQDLVEFFKGDREKIKKYIIDNLKESVIKNPNNKLTNFIDVNGKSKERPISNSTIEKSFFPLFIDSKKILTTNMDYKADEGLNPRTIEIEQLIQLMNILAEQIYCGKFDSEIGVAKIEDKIVNKKDANITDEHLIAYRMSKEPIMNAWLGYIQDIIKAHIISTKGSLRDTGDSLFQVKFDPVLWEHIENFIKNLVLLPLWKDRSMAETHFAGKNNNIFWKTVFSTGKTPTGALVLAKPLNWQNMITD